jgi:hypothetical protein
VHGQKDDVDADPEEPEVDDGIDGEAQTEQNRCI